MPRLRNKTAAKQKLKKKKEGGNYFCSLCNKSYRAKVSFMKHMMDVHNTKKEKLRLDLAMTEVAAKKRDLPCKLCSKKFKFLENYRKHLKMEHSKLPESVECAQCSVRCPTQADLDEHVKKAHEKGEFACAHCGQTFVRHYHVVRHLKQSGCQGADSTVFECEICYVKFTRKDNLLVHLRTHLAKKFTCKQCPFMAIKFNKYVRHVQEEHMEKKFICDVCGKVLGSRGAITKHLEIHGAKKYACEVCNYQTFTIEVMKRHVLRHTSEKPYKCELCPASFIQSSQLRRHTASKHDGVRCELCSETFSTLPLLIDHIQNAKHKQLEDLTCPFPKCSFAKIKFVTEELMKEHLVTHTDKYKEFACDVCNKQFRSEMTLKSHVRTHWLERPRRCMYCVNARAYIRGDMLLRHVRVKHPHIFREHLTHVRDVMGVDSDENRVSKSEMASILSLLDEEADRILEQGSDGRMLYAGLQEEAEREPAEERDGNELFVVCPPEQEEYLEEEGDPLLEEDMEVAEEIEVELKGGVDGLLSEDQLAANLEELLSRLIDTETLEGFGWPGEPVDEILEKVIEQCGGTPVGRSGGEGGGGGGGGGGCARAATLRSHARQLFLHVVEDATVAKMLATHTIDQVITHLLKVSAEDTNEQPPAEPADHEQQEFVVQFETY